LPVIAMSSSRSGLSFTGRFSLRAQSAATQAKRLACVSLPPNLDRHRMRADAEHGGDHMLDLARMLGRDQQRHVLVLAGDGERDLAFEVEMLLTADRHRAFQPARARGHGRRDIAAFELERVGDEPAAGRTRGGDVEERGLFGVLCLRQHGGMAGLFARFGDHCEERLAVEPDPIGREDRLVMAMRRGDVVGAGNIGRRQHRNDAGRGTHRIEIERGELPMGDPAQAEIGVKQAFRRGDVVDVEGLAGDMLGCGVVDAGTADRPGLGDDVELAARVSHGRPPRAGRRPVSRFAAASSRSGSAAAGCRRS
jgi:hypothetical protein